MSKGAKRNYMVRKQRAWRIRMVRHAQKMLRAGRRQMKNVANYGKRAMRWMSYLNRTGRCGRNARVYRRRGVKAMHRVGRVAAHHYRGLNKVGNTVYHGMIRNINRAYRCRVSAVYRRYK